MRIVMMGTGTFAEPTFEALLASGHTLAGLVTQPDRPGGHERGSTRQVGKGMKTIALEHGVPVFQPENVNTPEGVAGLQAFQPELLVVAAYGRILNRDVLGVPPFGGINVHASLLPKYRGAAPVAWAIYHGETQSGVTIIRMSLALDGGDMLAQETLDILPDETAGELESRLAPIGARLAVEVVNRLTAGPVAGVKQDESLITKAPKLKKEDGLLDWSRHGRDVCNQIRAMHPWPTAYTFWRREGQGPVRLIIHKARWGETPDTAEPGTILLGADSGERLRVAAGAGTCVEVLELQPAGKRRMAAEEFLRGRRPVAGDRLGPEA
jgi:methionyl-tRNA formyltransferase